MQCCWFFGYTGWLNDLYWTEFCLRPRTCEWEQNQVSCQGRIHRYQRGTSSLTICFQWRIQNFPEQGAPSTKVGAPPYYFGQFSSQKLHENVKTWTGDVLLVPPWIRQWFFTKYPHHVIDKKSAWLGEGYICEGLSLKKSIKGVKFGYDYLRSWWKYSRSSNNRLKITFLFWNVFQGYIFEARFQYF